MYKIMGIASAVLAAAWVVYLVQLIAGRNDFDRLTIGVAFFMTALYMIRESYEWFYKRPQ
jgi:hypothetical protein